MRYRTVAGDRWDQVSMEVYGRPDRYDRIIRANPELSLEVKTAVKLPGGLDLEIPDIEDSSPSVGGTPPWRR